MSIVKKFSSFPFSVVCILLIIVFCLIWVPPHSEELDEIKFIDKWVHALMYVGTCGVMCLEHSRTGILTRRWKWSIIGGMILFGGFIEICQGVFTATRSAEWIDLAADAVGTLLGVALGSWLAPRFWKFIKK